MQTPGCTRAEGHQHGSGRNLGSPTRGGSGGSYSFRRRNFPRKRRRGSKKVADDPWNDPTPEDIDGALAERNALIQRPFPHQRWQPGDRVGSWVSQPWYNEPLPPVPPSKPNTLTNFVNWTARLLTDVFPSAPIRRPPPPAPRPPPIKQERPAPGRPGKRSERTWDDWGAEYDLGDEWAYRPDGVQPPPEYIKVCLPQGFFS
jgi:hypothetical protein